MSAQVLRDHQRRTCIEVARDARDDVHFIELDVELGLEIRRLNAVEFDDRFKPVPQYPVERAAKLYAGYALSIGATPDAMAALGKLCDITKKEVDMASAKKKAKATTAAAKEGGNRPPVKKAAAKKGAAAPAKKAAAPAKKVPAVQAPAGAAPAKKTPAQPKERKATAASRFQALIMEGKLTDAEIFAKVQAEFGLDDGKRSYVAWYRNHLAKAGKNPPAAKSAPK